MQLSWRKLLLLVSCTSVLTVVTAFGQGKGDSAFDVASIRVHSGRVRGSAPSESPGRADYPYIGLRGLIEMAYDVSYYQVVWPAWLGLGDPSFYDVKVTFPPSTSKATVRLMWQHLLASRFGMAAHWETRSRPVYAMVVSPEGLRIQKSVPKTEDEGKDSRAPAVVPGGFSVIGGVNSLNLEGDIPLSRISAAYGGYLDRPLVDATGLEGDYSITLSVKTDPKKPDPNVRPGPLSSDMVNEMMGWDNARFFEALRLQLGIEVEKRVMPLRTLVIERLNKAPTEN